MLLVKGHQGLVVIIVCCRQDHKMHTEYIDLFLSLQVTAYTHKDDNNKWLVKFPNFTDSDQG